MKNIIYVMVFLLQGVLYGQEMCRTNVDLRGRDCNGGLGICSANTMDKNEKISAEFIVIKGNTLQMVVDLAQLSAVNRLKFENANQNTFIQEFDFVLDNEFSSKLKLPLNIKITKGFYPVIIKNNKAEILFLLSPTK